MAQALSFNDRLTQELDNRRAINRYREAITLTTKQSVTVESCGKRFVNFSSNDYLGLASREVSVDKTYGTGSGASHLICGHHTAHEELEKTIADFQNREAATSFSTGYMANLSLLQTLAKKHSVILSDKLNHASLIDGAKLSNAESLRYAHCDLAALERRLKKTSQEIFVVTDSVFSMEGDIAPLDQIAGLCEKYSATLIVDDAHGFGVLGQDGRGAAEYFGLSQKQLPILMGTLGKAIGGYGAFVSGSRLLIDYLTQFARPYVYTTAAPPYMAEINRQNIQHLIAHPELISKLNRNIEYFKQLCLARSINLLPSTTAIQSLIIGAESDTLHIGNSLKKSGFIVGTIRPPTVAENSSRLRITLSAAHTHEQIENLVGCLSPLVLKEVATSQNKPNQQKPSC